MSHSSALARLESDLRMANRATRNTMCFDHAPSVRVPFHPTPSPLQQRAFDLLGVKPITL